MRLWIMVRCTSERMTGTLTGGTSASKDSAGIEAPERRGVDDDVGPALRRTGEAKLKPENSGIDVPEPRGVNDDIGPPVSRTSGAKMKGDGPGSNVPEPRGVDDVGPAVCRTGGPNLNPESCPTREPSAPCPESKGAVSSTAADRAFLCASWCSLTRLTLIHQLRVLVWSKGYLSPLRAVRMPGHGHDPAVMGQHRYCQGVRVCGMDSHEKDG